jgi:hypothetical protein
MLDKIKVVNKAKFQPGRNEFNLPDLAMAPSNNSLQLVPPLSMKIDRSRVTNQPRTSQRTIEIDSDSDVNSTIQKQSTKQRFAIHRNPFSPKILRSRSPKRNPKLENSGMISDSSKQSIVYKVKSNHFNSQNCSLEEH